MANTSLSTKTNEISLSGAQSLVNSVKDGLKLVSQGYLAITPDVAKLYNCKAFKALGYKNFDEMCAMEFGMSHGTTVGIRKVFDKFASITNENKYIIPEKYLEYGYTKLLLFTDKKFVEAGIDPIEAFTPDMTMAEMKTILSDRLEAKADKQDKEAIDTTATEVNDSTEVNKSFEDSTEDSRERTPIDILNDIVYLATEFRKATPDMKPEKAVLIEAIIANVGELKKEVIK